MSIFMRLNTEAPVSIGTVPEADIERFAEHDPFAYGHWIFKGGTDEVLTARGSTGKTLTKQGDDPGYGADYLLLNMLEGNALLTDLEDTAGAEDTMAAVVQISDPGLLILLGTLTTGADGGSLFMVGAPRKLYATIRGTSIPIANSTANTADVVDDTWVFIAMSRSFSGGTKVFRQALGGEVVTNTALPGVTYNELTGETLALGNAYYANGTPGGVDIDIKVRELIVYDRALSSGELQGLYAWRKAVLAADGIDVE